MELLAKGSPVNAQDQDGRTPLMWAATAGRTEIMRLLLMHGAAINMQDDEGETALHQAVWATQSEAVKLLLKQHPNLKLKDRYGNNVLGLTSRVHHFPLGIIRVLEQAGAKWPPEGSI